MRRPLLIVSLLLITVFSVASAQSLRVAKDNLACAYGLKNSEGKWVVPALYTLIEATPTGEFIVTAGLEKGLLNSEGETLLKPQYDEIDRFGTPWGGVPSPFRSFYEYAAQWNDFPPVYLVKKKQKYGLASHKGNLIFPVKYERIRNDYPPNLILYSRKGNAYRSVFTDTTGHHHFAEMDGYLLPFGVDSLALVGDYAGSEGVQGAAGVVNRKGKVVIPRVYEAIGRCGNDQFRITQGQKHGMLDRDGKVVVPPRYSVLKNGKLISPSPCLSGKSLFVIQGEAGMGLMTGEGEVVLEPTCDHIEKTQHYETTPNFHWRVVQNGKHGTLNAAAQPVIETKYDTLIRLFVKPGGKYYEAPRKVFFVFSEKGQYGLLSETGTLLEPADCDTFLVKHGEEKSWVFMARGESLTSYELSGAGGEGEAVPLMAEVEDMRLYRVEEQLIPFLVNDVGWQEGYINQRQFGKLSVIFLANESLVLTPAGKLWAGRTIQEVSIAKDPFLKVHTKSGQYGVLYKKTGELIVDTSYANLDLHKSGQNRIWAQVRNTQNPAYQCGGWVILDTLGKGVTPSVFDRTFAFSSVEPVISGGKMGLLDTQTLTWKIPPQFGYIEKEISGYRKVASANGKRIGLMDLEGKLRIDTAYDDIREVYHPFGPRLVETPEGDFTRKWWLVTKGARQELISENNIRITEPYVVEQKLVEFALVDTRREPENRCSNCLKVTIPMELSADFQESPLKSQVYKIAYPFFERYNLTTRIAPPVGPCYEAPILSYKQDPHTFELLSIGDRYFSLDVWHYVTRYSGEMPVLGGTEHKRINCIVEEGELKTLSLQDLFPTQVRFQEELIRAIGLRDDLDLDCSAPEKLVQDVGERFSIGKEGVTLFLVQHERFGGTHQIMIPWARVKAK